MNEPVGVRLKYLRGKRRLSQTALAGLAGMSSSFISRLEAGDRQLLRRADLYRLAEALQVSPSQLTGRGESAADPVRMVSYGTVADVRRALLQPADSAPQPFDLVEAEVSALVKARLDADFVTLGQGLPVAIDRCTSGLHAATGAGAHDQWLGLLARAVHLAHLLGKGLAMPDLSALASEQHRRLVVDLDPVAQSIEASVRSALWTTIGMREQAVLVGLESARLAEPYLGAAGRTGHDAAVAYAAGHLTVAISSASLQRRGDVVTHIAEAGRVAARLPYGSVGLDVPMDLGVVRTWAVWSTIEAGEPDRVRPLARGVDLSYLAPERRASMWMDTARGLAEVRGEAGRAVAYLRMAEAAAPQRVRAYSLIREIVSALIGQVRDTVDREYLLTLGRRIGLESPT